MTSVSNSLHKPSAWLALLLATAGIAACADPPEPPPEPEPRPFVSTSFETLSDSEWDSTAVRQVLHVFALGGFATDGQIRAWADMTPQDAIIQMLTFFPFNQRLSPGADAGQVGTLAAMSAYWADDDGFNIMAEDDQERYGIGEYAAPDYTWLAAISRTGANPFRQRIGLFEISYHMSVNRDAGVTSRQLLRYYDDIMTAHANHQPYEEVMAIAARSAAVATQYNHRENEFVDARFEGNEDFGREFHQLFFGILGVADPEQHELVTIRNTAKLLTDMPVLRVDDGDGDTRPDDVVTFGSQVHFPGALEILGESIQSDTAGPGIDRAAEVAIAHSESLANLPLIVVKFLADDVLDETETTTIQAAWAGLESRSLLDFIRAYAISTTFHSPTRIKYWSTIERNVIASSLTTLTRDDVTFQIVNPYSQIRNEGVRLFRPLRNVFGGQTGLDAIGSGDLFRSAYNQSIDAYWRYGRTRIENDDDEVVWLRDWGVVAPKFEGHYVVRIVAEWLWQRYIADGLAHFGVVERAHVYALLGSGRDFGSFINEDNPMEVYTAANIAERGDLQRRISDNEVARMDLGSGDADARRTANDRVGRAVNFIIATPYAFIQEGR